VTKLKRNKSIKANYTHVCLNMFAWIVYHSLDMSSLCVSKSPANSWSSLHHCII